MINEAVENDLGNTPQLITKIKDGNIDDAKKLLKEGIYPLFYKDKYGNTALIAASKHGPPDLVRALLKAGALKANDGGYVIIAAVFLGDAGVIRALLEAGANKEVIMKDGLNPV